jgi:outer membrane protein, multidrug efflux system
MELRMFKRTFTTMGVSVATSLLLAGCGTSLLTPNYQRPALAMPATLATGATNPATTSGATSVNWLSWWKGFQDPVLDALLQEAAAHSQDLALASARIEEARATLDQTKSSLFPTIDLTASASRKRGSENASTYNASAGTYSNDRQLALSASYEIDFWGKYSQSDAAARARLLAQSANRGTVLTTLYANVAQSYFALRALDEQTQLAEQTYATRQENLRLQKLRFEAGVVSELDLSQAESEASSVQATLQLAQQNRRNAEAALALLLGRSPADIMRPVVARGATVQALYAAQVIPANVQSDVLYRRPDVVSAEQALIAANADIGIARAAYFPRLSLTASVGQQSNDMSTLMDPASMFWNLLGNLTQPIFRAGAIDAVVAASNARQKQALAQYTQTVQNALRDVHDALNNVAAGQDITTTTAQRIDALRSTFKLATLRYTNGYSSYLEVLNAQRDLHQAEAALIDTQRTQLNAVVGLYKALGGGWDAQGL